MGGAVETTDGQAPLVVEGSPLRAIDYELPVASAQVKSAVLLAGIQAEGRDDGRRADPHARPHRAPARARRRAMSHAGRAASRSSARRPLRLAGSGHPGRHLVGCAVSRRGRDRAGIRRHGARRRAQPAPHRPPRRARAHGREDLDLQPAPDRRRAGRRRRDARLRSRRRDGHGRRGARAHRRAAAPRGRRVSRSRRDRGPRRGASSARRSRIGSKPSRRSSSASAATFARRATDSGSEESRHACAAASSTRTGRPSPRDARCGRGRRLARRASSCAAPRRSATSFPGFFEVLAQVAPGAVHYPPAT